MPSSNDNPTPAPRIGRPCDRQFVREPAQPASKNTVGRTDTRPYATSVRLNQYASPACSPGICPRTVCVPPRYQSRWGGTVPTLVPALTLTDALQFTPNPRDSVASSAPRP